MTPEGMKQLKELIIRHESYKQFPYTDTTGNLTVGIGRNLRSNGIYYPEAYHLMENDVNYFNDKLSVMLPFFSMLDDVRQMVLLDLCFNVGINGLMEFKKMIECLEKNDTFGASDEILNSLAAKENPIRYKELATMMRTGEYI